MNKLQLFSYALSYKNSVCSNYRCNSIAVYFIDINEIIIRNYDVSIWMDI